MSTSSGPTDRPPADHKLDPVVVEPKQWWKSKTNWLHITSAVILGLETHFSLLQPYVQAEVFSYWILGINVAGVLMRSVTTAPVTK